MNLCGLTSRSIYGKINAKFIIGGASVMFGFPCIFYFVCFSATNLLPWKNWSGLEWRLHTFVDYSKPKDIVSLSFFKQFNSFGVPSPVRKRQELAKRVLFDADTFQKWCFSQSSKKILCGLLFLKVLCCGLLFNIYVHHHEICASKIVKHFQCFGHKIAFVSINLVDHYIFSSPLFAL